MMNMTTKGKWHGKAASQLVFKTMGSNLADATKHLRDVVRDDIARPGSNAPPVHSAPGQPPFQISGDLSASYFYFVDRRALLGVVGSDSPYAIFLELGTPIMNARPHLEKNMIGDPDIPTILGRPIV